MLSAMKHKERKKRLSVNATSLIVTCLFLFLAVEISDGRGSFTTRIKKITENLDMAVLDLDIDVNYSDFHDTSQYNSSTTFNAAGMVGLYDLTNLFIDVCAPEDILMPGLISINERNQISFNNLGAGTVISYYKQLIALVVFLLLCMMLFPVCGFYFCCCRCCGNCGAKPLPSDKKRDTCKKVIQATLLIMCGTGLLFCIVCGFGSNQQFHDGLNDFPSSMHVGVSDTKRFMDTTNSEIRHLLKNNYKEFADKFNEVLDNSSSIVLEQLMLFANAANLSEIQKFSQNLQKIRGMLFSLKDDTNQLRVYASQLNDAVRKIKWDLVNTLSHCNLKECDELRSQIQTLQTSIDFNAVPDVTDTINSFTLLNIDGIQEDVEKGNRSLTNIKVEINSRVSSGISQAREKIKDGEKTIDSNLDEVTKTVNDLKVNIDNNFSPIIDTTGDYIKRYGSPIYYFGLTVCCILLLVAVCIVLGLICGICGKRPDGYSDNCCNKGAGSRFLMCAVGIMFLFGWIISTITLVTFVTGVITEKAICDSLRNPDPNKYNLIKLLDDNIKGSRDYNFSISEVMNNCFQNKSIYTTLNLKTVFNLKKINEDLHIDKQLDQLNFTVTIDPDFTLVPDSTFDQLSQFKPDIHVDKFKEELNDHNFTNYNLDDLTNSLENVINKLKQLNINNNNEEIASLISQLQLSLLHLTTYSEKLIVPMKTVSQNLIETATTVSTQVKMGYGSFEKAIESLRDEITKAQEFFRHQGPDELNNISKSFISAIKKMIYGYSDRISDQIEDRIGQCGPISLVFNSTITSTCDKVLLPLNGFWFSLFWTIILYVITIVVAVKLANLYQRHKPYDQFVETRGKRGKKKGKKSKRYEERPGRDVARDFPGGSHPPDGRYADIAPKFSNTSGQKDQNSNNVTTRF